MNIIKLAKNKFLFCILAILGSASAGATMMTLIALSTSLYAVDQAGRISSVVYILYYLGVATIGFCGGWVLRNAATAKIGLIVSFTCALLVFFLGSLPQITPKIGLLASFIISLLNGLDHPNAMRFLNIVVEDKDKVSFFSIKECSVQIFTLTMPVFAALTIKKWGINTCFLLSGLSHLLGCIPWILLIFKRISLHLDKQVIQGSYFLGFKYIFSDKALRLLTLNRILNNFSYGAWLITLPLVLASLVDKNSSVFGQEQGFAMSVTSLGVILASFIGVYLDKKFIIMNFLVWGASIFSFCSVLILFFSMHGFFLLYISAFLLGLGTYCFRISGITLGQLFTPKEILGEAIIGGDTITRGATFISSLFVAGLFRIMKHLEIPEFFCYFSITLFSGLSLTSPFLIQGLVNEYTCLKSNSEIKKV